MKRIVFLISLVLCLFNSKAQVNEVRANKIIADQSLFVPVRDTNFTPQRVGQMTYRTADEYYYCAISTTAPKKWERIAKYLDVLRGIDDVLSVNQSLTANRTINANNKQFKIDNVSSYYVETNSGNSFHILEDGFFQLYTYMDAGGSAYHDFTILDNTSYHQLGNNNRFDLFMGNYNYGSRSGYFRVFADLYGHEQIFAIDSAGLLVQMTGGKIRFDSVQAAANMTGRKVFVWNPSTWNMEVITKDSIYQNIGNANLTLTADRTLNLDGKTFTIYDNGVAAETKSLLIDRDNGLYQFGAMFDDVNNNLALNMNNISGDFSLGSASGGYGIFLDASSGEFTVQFGGSKFLKIVDNSTFELGDIDPLSNGTKIRIDDPTETVTITNLGSVVDTTTYKSVVADASGNLKRMNYWPGGGGSGYYLANIYLKDSALSSSRIVNLNGNSFSIRNGSTSGDPGLVIAPNSYLSYTLNSANTSTVEDVFVTNRVTGTAANGIGGRWSMNVESIGATNSAFDIVGKFDDVGSRHSSMDIYTRSSGTSNKRFTLAHTGQLTLDAYGSGSTLLAADSTNFKVVVADASGNLFRSPWLSGGGSYTDEQAQDAIGAMIDASLNYVDGTPLLQRAALTGDVTASAGSNATTIANDAVTYAKMQNVSATNRFIGRITSGAGDAEELTGTQATTLLDVFTSGLKGLAPASGGGTTNFLRADGTWTTPSSSTWNGLLSSTQIVSISQSITSNSSVTTNSSPITLTMPTISGNSNRVLSIKNGGSADITIERAGSDQLYTSSAVNTFDLNPGESVSMHQVGSYWYAFFEPGTSGGFTQEQIEDFTGAMFATDNGDIDFTYNDGTPDIAAVIKDGSVQINDLDATGTPNTTTFLRGDGTWAVPTGVSWNGLLTGINTQSGAISLSTTYSHYAFNGGSPVNWTVPTIAGTPNQYFSVKNIGSATVTLIRSSSDQFYTTSAVTSHAIAAGEYATFFNNGTYWVVHHFPSGVGGGADALGTYIVQTATNAPANAQIMASLSTGLVKNTTTTGVQSIASAGTDYIAPTDRRYSFQLVTGTDANITAAAGTAYHLPAATLSTGRTIDVTNLNTNGDYVEFYNNEEGFVWSFTGATVYDSDGATAVTELLINANSVIRRINGKLMISKL